MWKQETTNAAFQKKSQNTGLAQWIRQHLRRTHIGDISGQDPEEESV